MKFLLDLIFPKVCVECGKEGKDICEECFQKILTRKVQVCPDCKRKNTHGKFCSAICKQDYSFDQLIVCTDYSHIKKLIIKFKYKYSKETSKIFAKLLKAELKNYTKTVKASVVPAPIHKKNLKKRGFNQAFLLAKEVIKIFPNSKLLDCLAEKENRTQQAKLDRSHRLNNLKNSIRIHQTPTQNILLIDDIVTTGSTLNECSKVLKKAGATYITAIVLARN